MEDLDLDELDQAVNKMMDKSARPKSAPKRDDRLPAVPPRPEAPAPGTSVAAAPEPKPEPAAVPSRPADATRVAVNRPMPRVPERRRMHPGAMDIIQPVAVKPAPSARPHRTGIALQPTNEVKPEPVTPAMPAPEPKPEPKPAEPAPDVSDELLASLSMADDTKARTPAAPAPAEPKPAAREGGWPDPLDFHDFGDTTKPAAEPAPNEPPELAKEPSETPPSLDTERVSITAQEDDAARTTPFVTTKVEKRPLGAYADATPAPESPKADFPEPADSPVPHEGTSKGELAETSLESKHHMAEPEGHTMDDLRQMAIPQQYHTAEQHPGDKVHPVFDTKEYHAPPQHMHAAHKGGPGLVIGVVVLIVLIIAAVLVGYFMMTGTFDITQLW